MAFRQPVNAEIAQGIDMGTIVDRQRRGITFCVGDVVVSEIDAIFVARLSVPSAQVVTTIHQIVNGVAEVGADYVAAAGTLEFASGEKEIRAKLLRSARD
ncbi:MAG: hypothetical protein OXL40_12785 [Bacteroidota bacterium]|nr:hypothetical protein [Bacteroidota bacterium]